MITVYKRELASLCSGGALEYRSKRHGTMMLLPTGNLLKLLIPLIIETTADHV
jgi:hypothetical protein